jgi:hypothetical protein
MSQMIGLGAGLLLLTFMFFCLRQGSKARPREGLSESSYLAGGTEHGGSEHGGSDDGGGSGH